MGWLDQALSNAGQAVTNTAGALKNTAGDIGGLVTGQPGSWQALQTDATSAYTNYLNLFTLGQGSALLDAFKQPNIPTPQTPGGPPSLTQIRQQQLDDQLNQEKIAANSNPVQTTSAGLMGTPTTSRVLLGGNSVAGASLSTSSVMGRAS